MIFLLPISSPIAGEASGLPRQQFHKALSREQKAQILVGDFSAINAVEKLPKKVRAFLAEMFGQKLLELANPGQKYQATDVGEDGPVRRLVFAGISARKCFVYYERGGRGHGYFVIVLRIGSQKKVDFLWAGAGDGDAPARDLKQLRVQVSAGQFKDGELYSW
jgi:hypothetical protein